MTTAEDTARLGAEDTQAVPCARPAEPAAAPATPGVETGGADGPLAQENAALARENAQLRQAAQEQALTRLLGELRYLGKLTPGLEQAGAAQILASAYAAGPQLQVRLPGGGQQQLGEALAGLFYALPASWGGAGDGYGALPVAGREAAGRAAAEGWPARGTFATPYYDGYDPLPPRLSAQEQEIAQALGLTAQEYAGLAKQ
jgi:hypothetical protein